jgi:glycosyltransferase involved in cell wall biosynthesis
MTPLASVIMPTFNQKDFLQITLDSFTYQEGFRGAWEVILVDDGSEDGTSQMIDDYVAPYQMTCIHCSHRGRAAARNTGLKNARGEIIIFCDSDRAVGNKFIKSHLQAHTEHPTSIVVGDVWELYFSNVEAKRQALQADLERDFERFGRFARRPYYAKIVYEMFGKDGLTQYAMPWIAFFSGNISVPASHLRLGTAFDEQFVEWGFEHFELGYRLYKAGLTYVYAPQARNYHFAHRRPKGFYERHIKDSYAYFLSKHPTDDVKLFHAFLYGEISLQAFHNHLAQKQDLALVSENNPIYYRQLAGR